MKLKQKKHSVPTDELYVENINLITGVKFNYDRPLLTQKQIQQLCIEQHQTLIQKFQSILKNGQKIQKWSIFENIIYYIQNHQDAKIIFQTIHKNYPQLTQFLPILGQGISNFLDQFSSELDQQTTTLIYDLTYRTLTQNPNQVQDWSQVFAKIIKFVTISIDKYEQYINGSFAMNSPPEKRRVAFSLMNHLMNYSKQIKKSATSKVLFFNKDQNNKTRYEICCIMKKIVQQNPQQDEVWKCIWQYQNDKDMLVKQLALQILCNKYYEPNFERILHAMDEQKYEQQFSKNISSFIITFQKLLTQNQRSKIQIISFFNRVFKSKKNQNICSLLSNLNSTVILILGDGKILENLNFSFLTLKNKFILEQLIKLCLKIQDFQFHQTLLSIIIKGLKQLQYQLWGNSTQLASILDLKQQDEINIYLNVCNKMHQHSKWHSLDSMLDHFKKISFCEGLYEKGCSFILKLWMNCPMFLLYKIISCVIYLVLINRKSLQFLITIRQKILNSKFWAHRKNYIIFYSIIKDQTSFQIHKLVPTLIYKNIISDKSFAVKLTLLQELPKIFMNTDPSLLSQKTMIKQSITKLEQDKDMYVKQLAKITKIQIQKIQKNITLIPQLFKKNKFLSDKQQTINQINGQQKRTIKTENQISKSVTKSKIRISVEQRKTVALTKGGMHKHTAHKQTSMDNITNMNHKQSISMPPKKNNLFRCHSLKIKGPPKKSQKS